MSSLFARKSAATSFPYSGISAVIHRVVYFSRQKSGYPSLVSQFTSLPDDGNEKVVSPTRSEENLMTMFEKWMAKYNKVYKSPEEKEYRFSIFKKMIQRDSVNYDIDHLNGLACNTLKEWKEWKRRIRPQVKRRMVTFDFNDIAPDQ